jgi:hypothetical protein
MPIDERLPALTRILAGLAGGVVLLFSVLISAGSSLFAPLGVLAADALARRNGGRVTRATAWVGAIIASMAVTVLVTVLIVFLIPAGARREIRAGFDSAEAMAREDQREELTRRGIDPASADRITGRLPTFGTPMLIIGGMLTIGVFGIVGGSAGWAATFLIVAAASGRWPWGAEPPPTIALGNAP